MNPNRIPVAIALALLIIGSAVAVRYAESAAMITEDSGRRVMQVLIGLVLVAYANVMPKELGRWRSPGAAKRSQAAQRVGGWSLTLAGLGYAGLWAFAPIAVADIAGMALVAAAMILTIAYGGWTRLRCRREQAGAEAA